MRGPSGAVRVTWSPTEAAVAGEDDFAGVRGAARGELLAGEGGGAPVVGGDRLPVPLYGEGEVGYGGARARGRSGLRHQGVVEERAVGHLDGLVLAVLAGAGDEVGALVGGSDDGGARVAPGRDGGAYAGLQEDAAGRDDHRGHHQGDEGADEGRGLEADGGAGEAVGDHQAATPA